MSALTSVNPVSLISPVWFAGVLASVICVTAAFMHGPRTAVIRIGMMSAALTLYGGAIVIRHGLLVGLPLGLVEVGIGIALAMLTLRLDCWSRFSLIRRFQRWSALLASSTLVYIGGVIAVLSLQGPMRKLVFELNDSYAAMAVLISFVVSAYLGTYITLSWLKHKFRQSTIRRNSRKTSSIGPAVLPDDVDTSPTGVASGTD